MHSVDPYSNSTDFKPAWTPAGIEEKISRFREKTHIIFDTQSQQIGLSQREDYLANHFKILGSIPPLFPEWLGDRTFQETHATRFPYICGEMANGISSVEMVCAAAKIGVLGFFGSAGLSIESIAEAIASIQSQVDETSPWGSNLIHSPHEPFLEEKTVKLYLKQNVRRVCASAYMGLNEHVVHYACSGLHRIGGRPARKNFLFAKISRPETAKLFMCPPPHKILEDLVFAGKLSKTEAEIARSLPLSEDITVEADSGGHTDNQNFASIFSSIMELRNKIQKEYKLPFPIRIGMAGGIGSPHGAAAAFSMGAAYILTGSINQACVESGLSTSAKKLLQEVQFGDTMMCAASDMFEKGVKLQVLKRGSMYGNRANKLYEVYRQYKSLEDIPKELSSQLEKDIFHMSFGDVWEQTKDFWKQRDPTQIDIAEKNLKHKMALVFRYYLGLSSKWAIQGDNNRFLDYQIWCGPAQAAFNTWVQGSFLEKVEQRTLKDITLNILEGSAHIIRAQQLRSLGVPVPTSAFHYTPKRLELESKESSYVH